jgi:trimeric autotransporter adhesin
MRQLSGLVVLWFGQRQMTARLGRSARACWAGLAAVLVLTAFPGVAGALPPAGPVAASVDAGRPLSDALAADGTLRAHGGSFDARGYRVTLAPNGAPRFSRVPAAGAAGIAAGGSSLDSLWSDRFGNVGLSQAVSLYAVAVSGADVYVGGSFTRLNGDTPQLAANNVAHWNGRGWSALGAGATNGTNGNVRAIAVSGSTVYVGGDFGTAGGVAASHVAKWNGSSWSALGAGAANGTNGIVRAIVVSGSTVYVGGTFDNAGSVSAHSIATWNGTTWFALGGGAPGDVNALLLAGSTLYIGGYFAKAGTVLTSGIATWNGSTWSALGGDGTGAQSQFAFVRGTVNALSRSPAGTLYIAGNFAKVGGTAARSVASWDGAQWHALGTGISNGSNPGTVQGLAFFAGKLFASGSFSDAGGDGQGSIAQWNGTAWLPVGAGLTTLPSAGPTAMAVSLSGVVAVGPFSGSGLTRLNNVGTWTGSAWTGFGLGLNGHVNTVAASGHQLYAGGLFSTAGVTATSDVAHFNGAGWDTMAGGFSGGAPSAVAVYGSRVYVGGSFSQAGTVPASNIAMWDGSAWHAVVDARTGGSGTDGLVLTLLVYNGKLWVGGRFSHAGGIAASAIATYDLTTNVWAKVGGGLNFDGDVNALTGLLTHYVVIGGGYAQVDDGAGGFATVNSLLLFDTSVPITTPFSGYLTTNGGGVTTNCGGSTCPGSVNALLSDGNKLYVGGAFDTAGTVASRGFARYDLGVTTNNWSSPGTVGGGSSSGRGTVYAIVKAGLGYYIGGDFSSAGPTTGPVAASNVASFNPATNMWAALGSGVSGPVTSLAQSSDGLYVGGQFSVAGQVLSQNLALWGATASPTISSFAPASGITGSSVTINGANLTGASAVAFNGKLASFTRISGSQVRATVPNGASTGKISVTTPYGTATSAASYTVNFSITSFSPASGPTGTVVTINGVGFNAGSTVKFNGVTATSVTNTSASKLVAVVPAAATSGPITVTNTAAPVGTVASASSYTVTPHSAPTISSFTPASGITGTKVTISGTFFSGASAVKFGTLAAVYTVVSPTQITAPVPNGAIPGKISVTTAVATTTSAASFTPTFSITSLSPASGPTGTVVTLNGVGFTTSSHANFKGLGAATTFVSATQLKATIPAAASAGAAPLTVTNTVAPVGTVTSATNYTKT